MMRAWLAAAGVLLSMPALAQQRPIQEQQAPPLQEQQMPALQRPWQENGPPPVQTLLPPSRPLTAMSPQDMTPVTRPNAWLPAGTAKLQALDKVNAQTTAMTVKVGQSATFGSLTITVKSCVVRPPDVPADAAAYLDVVDSHPDEPPFNGWLLWQEPSLSMLEHPIYDIRVIGCT